MRHHAGIATRTAGAAVVGAASARGFVLRQGPERVCGLEPGGAGPGLALARVRGPEPGEAGPKPASPASARVRGPGAAGAVKLHADSRCRVNGRGRCTPSWLNQSIRNVTIELEDSRLQPF